MSACSKPPTAVCPISPRSIPTATRCSCGTGRRPACASRTAPGSPPTHAGEMALWSLLGARGVDLVSWESFGEGWVTDVTKQLKLEDVRLLQAPYGRLPDLASVDPDRDTVFVWNGTTAGVRVPNGAWIAPDPRGRDGAVVAARRARGGPRVVGELRRGLGHRRYEAAEARGCPPAPSPLRPSAR